MANKAKKAKKAKKVTKSKGMKRATAKRATAASVPMQTVVQFVKMLIEQGHDREFEERAKRMKAIVTLKKDDVDFVRKFLARNDHLRPMVARSVRDPCPGNPFEC